MATLPTPSQYWAAMYLAKIAYTDETDADKQSADIASALRSAQPSDLAPWTLVWGPATDQGILAYVAQASDKKTYALAFRGSLSEFAAHDFIRNWFQDADAFKQVPFDYPVTAGAHISSGANMAFGSIQGLVDPKTQQKIPAFVDQLAEKSSVPLTLIIAGHSLGGGLSQIGALWLHAQLSATAQAKITFLPCTFAAPTFGNQQFADLFDKTFPNSYRAVNTLDIVPMAFENLDGIQKAYSPTGETISEAGEGLDTIVQSAKDSVGNVYRSPMGGSLLSFTGWMPATAAPWSDIVAANHASQLYLNAVQAAAAEAINKK
jgi:triacylglycerol lipase